MEYNLLIEDDEGHRSVVALTLGEATVGRLQSNTVRLAERNVSRQHARLYRERTQVIAEDLGSYNGVWVNGSRISGKHVLAQGDLLRIGDFHLTLSGQDLSADDGETTQRRAVERAVGAAAHGDGDTQPAVFANQSAANAALMPDPFAATAVEPTEPAVVAPKAESTAKAAELPLVGEELAVEATSILRPPTAPPQEGAARPRTGAHLRARLLCVSTEFAGNEFELLAPETVIGRVFENDIAIDHRSVSRHHAKIVVANKRYKIFDLKSANGTLVNREVYAQTELRHGDLIELGHVKLRFVAPNELYTPTAPEKRAIDGLHQRRRFWQPPWIYGVMGAVMVAAALTWALVVSGVSTNRSRRVAVTSERSHVSSERPPAAPHSDMESAHLATQVQSALNQQQWKRAQTLGNAVLALDPGNTEVQALLNQAHAEAQAQVDLDTALSAADQSNWSQAWNKLQEIGHESSYAPAAEALMSRVRPALVSDGLEACRASIKKEEWDAASVQLDELEGLEPGRHDVAELRQSIGDGRKRHSHGAAHSSRPARAHAGTPSPPDAPSPAHPPVAAEEAYNDGVTALRSNQFNRAIDSFNRCILADKSNAACYRALGITYARAGNGARATRYYRLYLKVDPNAHDADQVRQLLQNYQNAP